MYAGGEPTWHSKYAHLLDVNRADLALSVGKTNRPSSLYTRTKYVWEVAEDWENNFNTTYGNGTWDFILNEMGHKKEWNGSSSIQMHLKALALRKTYTHGPTHQYERFVIERMDSFYGWALTCKHLTRRTSGYLEVPTTAA